MGLDRMLTKIKAFIHYLDYDLFPAPAWARGTIIIQVTYPEADTGIKEEK